MNRLYTLAASIGLLSGTLVAQPTIDLSNNQPLSGQEFVLQTRQQAGDTWTSEGPTGADVDFNFWDLFATGNQNYRVFDATSSMPAANLVSTDGGPDSLYWSYADDGLYQVGARSTGEGLLSYSDPILELKYPCTFGTTWTDNLAANFTSPFGAAVRSGTVTGNADAWGDFNISEASLPSVLRVHVHKEITDVAALGTLNRVSDTWYFFSVLYPWPVLKLVEETSPLGTTRSAQWMFGPGGVSVGEIDPDSFTFTPYPNPTNGLVDLRTAGEALRSVEVLNATGQILIRESYRNAGTVAGPLDLSGLASGVYHVRITQADGRRGTSRVVVQ